MNKILNTENRKIWIDVLRGLAILFVMFGHYYKRSTFYFLITSPIKMPLFFAVSGYLFKIKDYKSFFTSLLKKIVVPWTVLTLTPPLLAYAIGIRSEGIGTILFEFISGKRYWFFPCLVIAEILFFLNLKLQRKTILRWITTSILVILGFIFARKNIMNFAMVNRALIAQLFLHIGFQYKELRAHGKLNAPWLAAAGVMLYVLLIVISALRFPGQVMDVHTNRYYNIPLCLLMIATGCFSIFLTAENNNWSSKMVAFIGQNSLIYYTMNGSFVKIFNYVCNKLQIRVPDEWYTALLKVIIVSVCCGVLAVFVNRFLPWCVGKKKT